MININIIIIIMNHDPLTGGDPVAGGVGGDQRGEVDQRQEGRLQQLHHDQGAWGQLQDENMIEDSVMNSDLWLSWAAP